jgi:mannose-1-phosphate guanylyltransferase
MRDIAETWAVVLAGGEGSRLRTLTTTRDGLVIPKQYCSLKRSSCLLQDALRRAQTVTMPSHVCTVVAAQHRRWWKTAVEGLNDTNVFVQPENKGTAYGILLALLKLDAINPNAIVTLLPADHYFRDEDSITRALRIAANLAASDRDSTYLLGALPDVADPELGYILPAARPGEGAANILGFTEKPAPAYARELIGLGALWNLFILVGSVRALLELYAEDHACAVARLRAALARDAAGDRQSLDDWYASVAPLDFSRDVLEVQAARLKVLSVPGCGWTDLGTPQRVVATVRDLSAARARTEPGVFSPLFFDLGAAGMGALP